MELRVCIDVDDLEKAVAFYGRALGLTPSRRFRNDWVEMVGASTAIDLLAKGSGTVPAQVHRPAGIPAIGLLFT